MKDNDRELLIKRLEIDGIENSLTRFLENAWDRNLKFKFESSQLPVHIFCRNSERNTIHRRGGAVLEVTIDIKDHGLEVYRWVAVFYLDENTGYYLEKLKDLDVIQAKERGTAGQIIMDFIYECPRYTNSEVASHKTREIEKEREDQIIRNIENRWVEDGGEF